MPTPDGKTMHAMIQIGDPFVMMSDEFPQLGCTAPTTVGGTSTTIHLYVEDADKTYNQAVQAGAKPTMHLMDAFWETDMAVYLIHIVIHGQLLHIK